MIHESLASLLVKRFAVQIEAYANLFRRYISIGDWYSSNPDDVAFGAETGLVDKVLIGRNSLVCKYEGILQLNLPTLICSHQPSRIVVISSTVEIASLAQENKQCLEIARFERG